MKIIALVPRTSLGEGGDFQADRTWSWMELAEFHTSVRGLVERLREGVCKPSILVLYADTTVTLRVLLGAADLLSGFTTILVLRPSDEESVTLAHRLRPRVLLSTEDAAEHIQAIVDKMLANSPVERRTVPADTHRDSVHYPP